MHTPIDNNLALGADAYIETTGFFLFFFSMMLQIWGIKINLTGSGTGGIQCIYKYP